MNCAWQQLLDILPHWIRPDVDRLGGQNLREIRLRLGARPELNLGSEQIWLDQIVTGSDLNFVINTASRYSPWSYATSRQGFITAPGGHRIGICGDAVIKDGEYTGVRNVSSVNVRVARDYPGIGKTAAKLSGSILLLGPPGSGKTTLLRDIIRCRSEIETVCVVDERCELFPLEMSRGRRTDVMTGAGKAIGIEMLLRTMNPDTIALDEVTSESDCNALIRAGYCGVNLLATAHGNSVADLRRRPVYQKLLCSGIVDHVLVLCRDNSWHAERMEL